MRPYQNGAGAKTPKGRAHSRRGSKNAKTPGGVAKTLVKAKVTAVKAKRRLQKVANGKSEEVEDLLNQTANGHSSTPMAAKTMKRIKSLVSVQQKESPSRRSARQMKKNEEKMTEKKANGVEEVAVEPTEPKNNQGSSSSGGLIQRTISKLWRVPEGITGVPYNDINGSHVVQEQSEQERQRQEAVHSNGCVVS